MAQHSAFATYDSTVLADGSVLLLREIAVIEEELLRRFYAGLSGTTLYRRFLTLIPRLPELTLAYVVSPGDSNQGIVVALHRDDVVGEARYHRHAGTDHAEVAVVVADAWKGRGVGRALAARLRRVARQDGVTSLVGATQADSRAARGAAGFGSTTADCQVRRGELEFAAPYRRIRRARASFRTHLRRERQVMMVSSAQGPRASSMTTEGLRRHDVSCHH